MACTHSKSQADDRLHFDKSAIHLPGSQLIKRGRDCRRHFSLAEYLHLLLLEQWSVVSRSSGAVDLNKLSRSQRRFGMLAYHKDSLRPIHDKAVAVLVMEGHNSPQTHRISECCLFRSQLPDFTNGCQRR